MSRAMNTKAIRSFQRLQGESHDISCCQLADSFALRHTSSVTENIEEMVISFLSQLARPGRRQCSENSEIDDASTNAGDGRKLPSKDYSIELRLVDRKKPDANGFCALFLLVGNLMPF